jgi:hypothetical protein
MGGDTAERVQNDTAGGDTAERVQNDTAASWPRSCTRLQCGSSGSDDPGS